MVCECGSLVLCRSADYQRRPRQQRQYKRLLEEASTARPVLRAAAAANQDRIETGPHHLVHVVDTGLVVYSDKPAVVDRLRLRAMSECLFQVIGSTFTAIDKLYLKIQRSTKIKQRVKTSTC